MALDHDRKMEEDLTVSEDQILTGDSSENNKISCPKYRGSLKFRNCDRLPAPSCPHPSSTTGYRLRRATRYSGSSMYTTSNSSSQEEEEVQQERLIQRRRRRRRHRKISSLERDKTSAAYYSKKLAHIEAALLNSDRDALAQLAVSQGGLLSDEIRARVWPRLMGINMVETDITAPTDEEIQKHPEYNQVVLDVNRSLKRFPPCIGEEERPALHEQLTRLIIRVIMAHPQLHYYQSYHDVAITFLLVVVEGVGLSNRRATLNLSLTAVHGTHYGANSSASPVHLSHIRSDVRNIPLSWRVPSSYDIALPC
uniref:Tbc1 domain family member 20 n=1 Tax=Pseudodiaptomus poplesia TaxID=213370 RepID=A0A1S6GL86_9MAXI|nr:tbc1 domain family member 20 [Pseudodiaptomus poplesia]